MFTCSRTGDSGSRTGDSSSGVLVSFAGPGGVHARISTPFGT